METTNFINSLLSLGKQPALETLDIEKIMYEQHYDPASFIILENMG